MKFVEQGTYWALSLREVALQTKEQNQIILFNVSLCIVKMGKVRIWLERCFKDFLMFLFIDFFKMLPRQFLSQKYVLYIKMEQNFTIKRMVPFMVRPSANNHHNPPPQIKLYPYELSVKPTRMNKFCSIVLQYNTEGQYCFVITHLRKSAITNTEQYQNNVNKTKHK